MRVIISVAVAFCIVYVAADDKSSCEKKCEKYEENDKKACLFGCGSRGSVSSGGPLSFVKCHRECDSAYNETQSEKSACHFACSLPMHSSVMMTLVSDNGSPKWKVVRQEGDDEPETTMQDESPFLSSLLGNRNNGLLSLRAPASFSNENENENEDDFGDFMKMHERIQQAFEQMRRQFAESLRASLDEEMNVARQRPTGHNPWGENSVSVGNTNEEGQPIILTRPVPNDEDKLILVEFGHRESRSRLMVLFHWLLVITGIAALFTTVLAICLFLRSLRTNNYRRMGREGAATMPIFARVQPTAPLPVKKIPEEGWIEHSQPSGVAPPAYDQVSIHASPIAVDSDKSTSEAETPSPVQ